MNHNILDIILLRRNDSRSRKLQKQDLRVILYVHHDDHRNYDWPRTGYRGCQNKTPKFQIQGRSRVAR